MNEAGSGGIFPESLEIESNIRLSLQSLSSQTVEGLLWEVLLGTHIAPFTDGQRGFSTLTGVYWYFRAIVNQMSWLDLEKLDMTFQWILYYRYPLYFQHGDWGLCKDKTGKLFSMYLRHAQYNGWKKTKKKKISVSINFTTSINLLKCTMAI